jgi:hypothetical protein
MSTDFFLKPVLALPGDGWIGVFWPDAVSGFCHSSGSCEEDDNVLRKTKLVFVCREESVSMVYGFDLGRTMPK